MTPVDRDILELLKNGGANRELVLTPGLIAENSDWSRTTVRNHLVDLREEGLVEYRDEDRAIHQLSDRGRDYIAGDLPPEDLDHDDE